MMKWKIGNGLHTRFWKFKWCGNEILQHKFPRLFLNVEQKKCLCRQGGQFGWKGWVSDLRWRRGQFEWEKHLIEEFFVLINDANIEGFWERSLDLDPGPIKFFHG